MLIEWDDHDDDMAGYVDADGEPRKSFLGCIPWILMIVVILWFVLDALLSK
jgi:hypothetical protein